MKCQGMLRRKFILPLETIQLKKKKSKFKPSSIYASTNIRFEGNKSSCALQKLSVPMITTETKESDI